MLQDIIRELENQLETKSQRKATVFWQLRNSRVALEQHNKTKQELREEVSYCLIPLL